MSAAIGTDWTKILADPDLVRHVGKLLQTYREAPVEKREEALVAAMREIKSAQPAQPAGRQEIQPLPAPVSPTPPFEPDLFSTNWSSDRRRHPRIKCFVAVELRVDNSSAPIWGNLGVGCAKITASPRVRAAKPTLRICSASLPSTLSPLPSSAFTFTSRSLNAAFCGKPA